MRRTPGYIAFLVLLLLVVCLALVLWILPADPGVITPTPITPQPETAAPTDTMESYPTATNPSATSTSSPTAVVLLTFTATPAPPTLTPPSFPTAVPTMTATLSPTATQLPFPSATPTATLTRLPESYVVQRDDWLIKIAIRLYGGRWGWEWRCLYERNRAVIGDNPHLIFRGQVLRGIRPCGGQGE